MIMNYDSMPQSNEVLILGGGPSIFLNQKLIRKIVKNQKPIVLGAHYEHVKTDYLYFNGKRHIFQGIERGDFECRNIIVPIQLRTVIKKDKILRKVKKQWIHVDFANAEPDEEYAYQGIDKIKVDKNGQIYHSIINAGMTALLTSIFFRPKRVILIGFDGPIRDENGNYLYYMRWSGGGRVLPPVDEPTTAERKREERYWKMLLQFVQTKGIEICTVRTDLLRGVNRQKLGVKIL